jgi:hypothetical protein
MQPDGNLVVYTPSGAALFASGRLGDSRSRLVVQRDGDVVVRAGSGTALWSSTADKSQLIAGQTLRAGQSRRSSDDRFLLTMQPDGNLVLYEEPAHRPLWSARTAGHPGASATLQRDGNLIVYGTDPRVLFATGTRGDAGSRLVVQADGTLVLVNGAGAVLWTSRQTR